MPAELTIEQLAAASGMSVRNIRAHQARGLVDPPEVRLRVGYYGPEHVAQLRLVSDLQADGFNLAGIKRLLAQDDPTAGRLARFRETVAAVPAAEAPQTLTSAQLARRFAVDAAQATAALSRAERLGILVSDGEGRWRVPSPALLDVAERVVARGVSLDRALAVFERVQEQCDGAAAAFVSLFMSEVWEPFRRAGMPPERWDELDASIAALRPLADEALSAIFGPRMTARIEQAFRAPGAGSR